MNAYSITLTLALAAVTLATAAHAATPANLLPNPGFEQGLSSWKTEDAGFSVDSSVKHGGKQSARITVAAEAELAFHQIHYAVSVKPGETYRGSVWIRRAEAGDGAGAYGVLEFMDGDKRVFVPHMDMLGNRAVGEWVRIETSAVAPAGATSLRFLCVFNSHGTAWYDDAQLTRIEPAPGTDPATTKLTLRPDEIITDRWQGFGCQGDLFLWRERVTKQGITDEDRALIRHRILAMRPRFVRLAVFIGDWEPERGKFTPDSEGIRDLRETLAIYKEAGTEIQITEWGYGMPEWCKVEGQIPHPEARRAFTDGWAALLKYLRNDCGFTNIRYITIYNEPNTLDWKAYSDVYRLLDASLKAAGIRRDIAVIGPDEACENIMMPKAVRELDDIIDYYDAHNYNVNEGRAAAYWFRPRIELMPKAKGAGVPARKRFLVTEFGMQDNMTTWHTPHNHEYNYGIFLADSAIVGCNEGVSAMSTWCLMDTDYGQRMKWGLWRFKDENWEPRPGFYAWSLITRYTELGSTIHPLKSNSPGVSSVAFRAPNGVWTLMIVNRAGSVRPLTISGLPKGSKWEEFVYSERAIPTADREMIRSTATLTANSDGVVFGSLPARSFVLWHEVR